MGEIQYTLQTRSYWKSSSWSNGSTICFWTVYKQELKAIDALVPVVEDNGELVNRRSVKTGKTSLRDWIAIINQTGKRNTICIYVAIGQKESNCPFSNWNYLKNTVHGLYNHRNGKCFTTAPLLVYRSYAGFGNGGRSFMYDGKHVLNYFLYLNETSSGFTVNYLCYSRRPPGRKAYPGDCSAPCIHGCWNGQAKIKWCIRRRSITALPMWDNRGEIFLLIFQQTFISITDGQIFLEMICLFKVWGQLSQPFICSR